MKPLTKKGVGSLFWAFQKPIKEKKTPDPFYLPSTDIR